MLTAGQVSSFHERGFLLLADAVSASQLAAMRGECERWIDESRVHDGPFGRMLDGRPRFDVEPGHSAETPGLRRVASPEEIAPLFLDVIRSSPMTGAVAQLIGPDLRFHHAKINTKLPGTATVVRWHQDFAFDPHSNDDCITCLVFLEDVTGDNGPLRVVPGSHRGAIHSHWHDGVFTGSIDAGTAAGFEIAAEQCTGPAGSACLMHTRLIHSSAHNATDRPRTLFITNLAAADAVPLSPCAVPSRHAGLIVRGTDPGRVRAVAFDLEAPEIPAGASFFVQQAEAGG